MNNKKLCRQPKVLPQPHAPGIDARRLKFIVVTNKKWVNSTEIKYCFIEGDKDQQNVVRSAFQQWLDLGIGLSFQEVTSSEEATVRIGFDWSDGSWSYVGRDILTVDRQQRTMNFGWDLTSNAYGLTTALHEIGHTIGFEHEHQNPNAGIEWNEDAVYSEFSGSPNNWTRADIEQNILNKIPGSLTDGSRWDKDSIMQYEFGPGLIIKPVQSRNGVYPPGVLSSIDVKGVHHFYPPLTAESFSRLNVLKSEPINALPGGQANFTFTAPLTKKYTFQTFGDMDTVMVVSEKTDDQTHYLKGADDSGFPQNSKIELPLVKGREYMVNVRVMFNSPADNSGIIVF